MAWKPDIFLIFEHKTRCTWVVMEQPVYTCKLSNCGPRICDKNLNFYSGVNKMGELESAEGNGRPSKKDAWSVEKISITDAP
jgi:hypothetical protein